MCARESVYSRPLAEKSARMLADVNDKSVSERSLGTGNDSCTRISIRVLALRAPNAEDGTFTANNSIRNAFPLPAVLRKSSSE